jgi:hypothetical protein
MMMVALHALAASIVGIILSVPIGIAVAKLLERDPADWRAFLRMKLPRKLSYQMVAVAGVPTASSATIIVPPPWQPPTHGPSHLRDLHHDNTRTDASIVVIL